jgi:RNA polymerase sigma factor (TIGR02999 family)
LREGRREALEELLPLVERELRRLARGALRRERPNHTLQTTALVNGAISVSLISGGAEWRNRAQFFGVAATLMRRILIDYARRRGFDKWGGGAPAVPIDEAAVLSPERGAELIALDEALQRLAAHDPRKHRVVELRYFGGASSGEMAELLGVSTITVKRDWQVRQGVAASGVERLAPRGPAFRRNQEGSRWRIGGISSTVCFCAPSTSRPTSR